MCFRYKWFLPFFFGRSCALMASEGGERQRLFQRLRVLALSHATIPHKDLSPFCAKTPYTKTVFESALQTLIGSDIRRYRIYSSLEGLVLAAFVHSKVGGRKWYVTSATLSSSFSSPFPSEFTCSCATNYLCEHVVSLLLFMSLLQELPENRPSWAARSHTLPSATVSSAHFMNLYGKLLGPVQEQCTCPFLLHMMEEPEEPKPCIWYGQPPKKGEPKRPWKTTSWKKGLQMLREVVGTDSDSDGDDVSSSDSDGYGGSGSNGEEEVESQEENESEGELRGELESESEVEDEEQETESSALEAISSGSVILLRRERIGRGKNPKYA